MPKNFLNNFRRADNSFAQNGPKIGVNFARSNNLFPSIFDLHVEKLNHLPYQKDFYS